VIHKLITSIWNKEEMPDQWKESIIVPIHKTGDKTDCNNYRPDTDVIEVQISPIGQAMEQVYHCW
jgi:hypothetical protein